VVNYGVKNANTEAELGVQDIVNLQADEAIRLIKTSPNGLTSSEANDRPDKHGPNILIEKKPIMPYYKEAFASVENIYEEFGTGENGLSSDEARRRFDQYGPNVPPVGKKFGMIRRFLVHLRNWFNVMLLLAATLSFFTGVVSQDPTSFQAGYVLVGVTLINIFFSLIQEYRANKVVQAINRLIPNRVKVVRDGQTVQVDVSNVVPGDMVLLEEGDEVPADIRLVSAFEVSVNNSPLTGESQPQHRFAIIAPDASPRSPTEMQDIVFAGTTIATGVAKGVVLSTGGATQIGRIISLSRQIREPPSALQQEMDHTARRTLIVAAVVGASFFGIALGFLRLTVVNSILFTIGVMISLVPEGLQLTVSLSLALTAFNMSKRNVVVKRLSSAETLGAMTVLCVDKTGTMTSGEMMVEKIWTGGKVFQVTGDGYNPVGLIAVSGRSDPRERAQQVKLFEVAAFCNNAKLNPPSDKLGRWTVLGDPTDGAFLVFAGKGDFKVQQALAENPRVHLLPFESKRRLMTSIHRGPDGSYTSYTKGACRDVLDRCTQIYFDNQAVPLTSEMRQAIFTQMDTFASQGYRVLGMASRRLPHYVHEKLHDEKKLHEIAKDVESDMTFLGIAALADPPRPMVKEAVLEAQRAGIKVIMLTGDYELTAEAIARRMGVISSQNPTIVTGHELDKMSQSDLARILKEKEVIFARILPEQKLKIVQVLRSKGEVVGVTGDGVNDAPALLEADVGVAMGVGGTDVARESADMVLLDNNFVSIVEAVKFGRTGFDNLKKFVGYLFTHNFAELGAFIAFVLLGVPLPLSVIQVLAIDLGMDVLPSLSLIMEPPQLGVMDKPPRKTNRLLDIRVLLRAAYIGTLVSMVALLVAFGIWGNAGWTFGQKTVSNPTGYAMGTTAVMVGIMAAQIGNLFATRTDRESAFKLSPLRNKWILIGIIGQIVIMITIVYLPLLQPFFGTAALSQKDLLLLYLLAPAVFFIEELRKLTLRRINR
jgi:Ca2+-transporting ATPase